SGESAMGRYPVDAVAMLAGIAAAIEPHREPVTVQGLFDGVELKGRLKPAHLVAVGVEASIRFASPAAVFVPTRSGATARSLALCRMPVWIIGVSSEQQTCKDLAFSYGVYPVFEPVHPDDWNAYVRNWLEKHQLTGDLAVVTEGPSRRHPEAHNRMEIIDLRRPQKP
ncbi:MAG: pyruvate kinase, partial [Deltaproteobacteria bacterium]|nr:pyruvate kinase [Deltaproteobacteria bacterium]